MEHTNTKKWALITGASSGIGEAFAKRLSKEGYNLVLVARRLDRLEILARSLFEQSKTKSLTCKLDLSDINCNIALFEFCKANNVNIDLLINNAGIGYYGSFSNEDDNDKLCGSCIYH